MKWISKNKKIMLDTDSITCWEYRSKEDIESSKELHKKEYLKHYQIDTIYVLIGGGSQVFRGEDAEEIYRMLLTDKKKEVIN